MKPEPVWRRRLRRPAWERDETRFSDYRPIAPVIIALNRIGMALDRDAQRATDLLERLERKARGR
jgi:hypothetical protein